MTPATTHPANASAPDRAAAARALIERQMARLERLADIGMELAEAALRAAHALADGAGDPHAADPALTFARVSRAVRLTLALQSRLAADLAALDKGEAIARAGEAGRRRNLIHRRVERATETDGRDAEAVENLSSAAWERLTEADDADLLDLPLDEAVARICRDLGLAADWTAAGDPPPPPTRRPPVARRGDPGDPNRRGRTGADRWVPGTASPGAPRTTTRSTHRPPGRRQP